MRLHPSSILIITCFSGLGLYSNGASAVTANSAPKFIAQAQVSSQALAQEVILTPGSQGLAVEKLQTQLQGLGHYNNVIDGKYGQSTKLAVEEFQKAKGLKRIDGIADVTTQRHLQSALAVKKNQLTVSNISQTSASKLATPNQPQPNQINFLCWSFLGIGILGSIGGILGLWKFWEQNKQPKYPQSIEEYQALSAAKPDNMTFEPSVQAQELEPTANSEENTVTATDSILPVEATSRLTKLSIVEELIKDLGSNDAAQRNKAIWDLGQQGDSRAIEPLVNLLIDADSQQRSLILAALSEINIRSLKPINRALAISMQDESPNVRQNAIRDLTRVYDMMAQMSQMLVHALDDPDDQVQGTAQYALSQIHRMRSVATAKSLIEDTQQDGI
ncbi:peptidoglycan-binding protein [Anabaena sp. CA = ATCC 33047]|uniref:peptidoglycan-binding protein n=1 Tax=Anabaena sp. (strain CA / ATCC 33047) TaxID=52271 RepID=UPI00083709CF|nr:peptidoglycan-binding protein [Anabaena sp. CA = ATCC 33047]